MARTQRTGGGANPALDLDAGVLDGLADAILERCALVAEHPLRGADDPHADGQLDGLATACVEQWAAGAGDRSRR